MDYINKRYLDGITNKQILDNIDITVIVSYLREKKILKIKQKIKVKINGIIDDMVIDGFSNGNTKYVSTISVREILDSININVIENYLIETKKTNY